MKNIYCLAVASLLLAGCVVNNYEKYYVDQTTVHKISMVSSTDHIGEPEISAGSSDKKADAFRMYENGYTIIGYSSFTATRGATREGLIAQAKNVHAAKVINYQEFLSAQRGLTRFKYGATYWKKSNGGIMGVFINEPTVEQRSKAGTNKGLIVIVPMRGGPAFKADILAGDIILTLNGKELNYLNDLYSDVIRLRGKLVTLEILRNGEKIQKSVQLNK